MGIGPNNCPQDGGNLRQRDPYHNLKHITVTCFAAIEGQSPIKFTIELGYQAVGVYRLQDSGAHGALTVLSSCPSVCVARVVPKIRGPNIDPE